MPLEAHRRSDRKLVVIVRDPQHHLPERLVAHLFGQDAGFFGAPAPMFRVAKIMRGIGHGRTITWASASVFRQRAPGAFAEAVEAFWVWGCRRHQTVPLERKKCPFYGP